MTESTRDTLSRVSSLALMIAILVVAAGVSAITAMRLAIRGKEVTVPVLTGKDRRRRLRQILETSKLVLRVSGNKRFSNECSCRQNRRAESSSGNASENVPQREGSVVGWRPKVRCSESRRIESSRCKTHARAAELYLGQHVGDAYHNRRASDDPAAGPAAGVPGRGGPNCECPGVFGPHRRVLRHAGSRGQACGSGRIEEHGRRAFRSAS